MKMARKTNTFTVGFRRKMIGRTNYRKRLALLLSNKPRLVVRKSSRNINVQLIQYAKEGDAVLASADSTQLKKYGWILGTGNLPTAYLTGLLAGRKAMEKGIKEAILDSGFHTSVKGSRIYSAVKGALDAGVKIPCSEEMIPPEDRIKGRHISDYAKINKKNFSTSPENMASIFEETKNKILKSA